MTWEPSDEEITKTSARSAEKRYEYFINKVLETEQLWSLKNKEGWVLGEATDELEAIPVWPHPKYAMQCATGAWADHEADSISLSVFIERFVPGMLEDKRVLAVFEVPDGEAFITDPGAVAHDLNTKDEG